MAAHDDQENRNSNVRSLNQFLLHFEQSQRSTAKGAALDEIACLASGGDQQAISALVRIIFEMRLAEPPVRSVLLDPADVDEAIQLTLISVATKIGTFEGSSSLKTWVGAIAKNEALQVVRRKKRSTEPVTNEIPDYASSARHLSSLVADEDLYLKAVTTLSDEHREVLQLREDLDLSYEAIAERLGIPVGTVRSRINRARILLTERILSANPDYS